MTSFYAKNLNLETVRNIALKNNLDLKSQELNYRQTKEMKTGALLNLFPSGRLTGMYQKKEKKNSGVPGALWDDNMISYGFEFRQQIFAGGKFYLNYLISKDQLKNASVSLEKKKTEIYAQSELKYFKLLEAKFLKEISENDLKSSLSHLKIAEIKNEQGLISQADLLKFESEAVSKEVTLTEVKNLYRLNMLDLKNYLKISYEVEPDTSALSLYDTKINFIAEIPESAIQQLKSKMNLILKKSNPDLISLKISSEIAEKSALLALGNFAPTVSASFSENWTNDYSAKDEFEDSGWSVTVNASLPVFPLADNYSDFKKAKINQKKTEYIYKSAEDRLKLQLESLLLSLRSSAKEVLASEKSVAYAERTYEQAEERFKRGMLSVNDMLDASNMKKSAELTVLRSKIKFITNKTGLQSLLMISDENDFFNIILNKKTQTYK